MERGPISSFQTLTHFQTQCQELCQAGEEYSNEALHQ